MREPQEGTAPAVRRATAADAHAMWALAQRAYAPYVARMGARPGPMDTDYRLAVERDEAWVVDGPNDTVIGLLMLHVAPDHLLLENVAVDPTAQGRGIGRTLMRLAEARARSSGLDEVRLYTHVTMSENQQMYEASGYVETHRSTDSGFHRVHYRKRLLD